MSETGDGYRGCIEWDVWVCASARVNVCFGAEDFQSCGLGIVGVQKYRRGEA